MKGKYITTNIVLACLASATASRKFAENKQRLQAEASKQITATINLSTSLKKAAA